MKNIPVILTITLLLGFLASSFVAMAQNGYELPWYSIDGGAARSQEGVFTLAGTIGQPDTGEMSGGDYSLQGGYWASEPEIIPSGKDIFLPLVIQNATH